jgi:hypothetical protein
MQHRRLALATASALIAFAAAPLAAQEHYWIGNRGSVDAMKISSCGTVDQTVPLTSVRSAHVAPDGKIWIVRFIQPQFDILNPDGTPFVTASASLGNPFDIAFDKNGHAWVSGGSGVEQFDSAGVSLAAFPLPAAAPLGISVDADGNTPWPARRRSMGARSLVRACRPPAT